MPNNDNHEDHVIVTCPHCQIPIYIKHKDFNCHIFRHATYKHNLEPINPHLKRSECERLKRQNLVYGCAKPFRLVKKEGIYQAEICDYL